MKIRFEKMTGAGNDFVVVDNRSKRITDGPKTARALCHRRWGVGADGLLLLERSRKAHYRMMYYNADGSYGGMCGNGGRCIALYAVRNRLAPSRHSFEALDYIYQALVKRAKLVTLWMKPPRELMIDHKIPFQGKLQPVNFVNTGSPHLVISVESLGKPKPVLAELDVLSIGRDFRHHNFFAPAGTNVNFIQLHGDKCLKIRTYERGVEDETLACGTGSIAAAIVASHLWKVKPPITIVPKSEVPLIVDFSEENGKIADVTLTGPAKTVFDGEIDI